MSIWFFYGKEEFIISKEIEKLKSQLLDSAFKTMNYRIFYSPSFEELLEISASAPLMFGNIISLIHCENYFFKFKNKKIDFSDEQIEAIDFALKNISDTNNLIFVCNIPRDDDRKSIDSRTKIFKTFAKYANVKEFPQYRDFDKELIYFLSNLIKEKDLLTDSQTIKFLIKQLGVNLRLIDTELEKIKTAIYPNKKFSEKDIAENCSLTEDVFALSDLVLDKNKNEVLKNFSKVIEKRHPLEIIALLQTNLHKLIFLKTYEKEKSTKEFSETFKIPEYPIKKLLDKIKNNSLEELIKLKQNLTAAEFKIKTGKTQNPDYLLENVILGGDIDV